MVFICRPHIGHLGCLVSARGYRLIQLKLFEFGAEELEVFATRASWLGVTWQVDAKETRAALENMQGVDWLVVDHYAIDARWEALLRPVAGSILAIDDLADRPHDCDILVDHNLHALGVARYEGLAPAGASRLTGPRYALLRAEFATARAATDERDGTVRRILVFFGGVDEKNLSGHLLAAIEPLLAEHNLDVDVVLGTASPHAAEVASQCAALPGVTFHKQATEMARLMAAADLAIGAAGTAVWERCCLGLPSIVVPVAENQLPGLTAIGDSGVAFIAASSMAPADALVAAILDTLHFVLRSPAALRHQSACASAMVDGAGCRRVARRMSLPALRVRRVTAADGPTLYAWRNHEDIRRQSRDSRPIEIAGHLSWLDRIVNDGRVDLLICEDAAGPLGVLRYDHEGDVAEVSIYLVPDRVGEGMGGLVLEACETWLLVARPGPRVLHAEVLADNPASRRIFEGAGYTPILHRLEKRINP